MMNTRLMVFVVCCAALVAGAAGAEIVYLNNGDIIHGTLVAANNTELTLKTDYGQLVIPKKDVQRIDYEGAEPVSEAPRTETPQKTMARSRPRASGDRGLISLTISGNSFWYAFDSPADNPSDTRIRLRLYVGSARACTLIDEKPDTVDGSTLYNSFTFSPTDSKVVEVLEGFDCSVQKTDDGQVELTVQLAPEISSGRQLLRMLYEVNDGDRSFPRWIDVVSRSFSVEVAPGRETAVILEQDADALEYSGFFKKSMKNLDLFQLNVLSTELRD